jgi:hypothetical protein
MLVLIGAKENHGPFGQNSMVPNGPWRYGLSLARGGRRPVTLARPVVPGLSRRRLPSSWVC